jgi:predicted dehydrogenase
MNSSYTRRQFVGGAAATVALSPAIHASGKAAPSGRLRIGLIGCGGRGRELLRVMQDFPDVEFPAVSDLFESRMAQAAKLVADGPQKSKPECVADHERIIERKDVDAVLIATTQHWHGIPCIQAAQAGKHVYVEKPLSHTVVEGRAMVEAAKKARIVAMMGAQQHGYPHYLKAVEILHSGKLGKIALVECWNYENCGRRVGRAPDSEPPPDLRWDRWLGPAPYVPFNRTRLANPCWFDYSGGMLTNWAIHHIDIILWAMQSYLPTSVVCNGGKLVVDDAADTPDTTDASWEFPGFIMRFLYRGFNGFRPLPRERNHGHGICFFGNQGTMVLDRSGFEIWHERTPGKSVEREDNPRFWGDGKPGNEVDGPWQRVFVDCIKAGKQPPMTFEQAHQATACCHLANIAYLTGHKFRWDGQRETIPGDPEAGRLLDRARRKGYELPKG